MADQPSPAYVDFGKTATDYFLYRPPLPAEYYDRLAQHGIGLPGQQVVDLGCGTGMVAAELARRGCHVTGVDYSAQMIAEAQRRYGAGGLMFIAAPAEATTLPDACCDALVASTCWHYFDHRAALAEARRIVRPGGKLAATWFYWLPVPGSVAAATEQLVLRYNPQWRFAGDLGVSGSMATQFTSDLGALETYSFDRPVSFTHEAWRLRLRSCGGVGVALDAAQLAAFEADLAALLSGWPEPLTVLHRVFAIVGGLP